METIFPKKSTLLLGITLLLATFFAIAFLGGPLLFKIFGVTQTNPTVIFASRVLFWLPLLIIFIYALKVEKQKLLIWQERRMEFWEYLVSVIAIFVALLIGLGIIGTILKLLNLHTESDKFLKMLEIFRANQWLIFITAFTAGIVEELTFRGYLMPRMIALFKSPAVAIILSSVLFGLLHFGYGTVIQIIGPFFIGFIFALYYYKFRNIKVLIFCHVAWDLMAIYLKMLFTEDGGSLKV